MKKLNMSVATRYSSTLCHLYYEGTVKLVKKARVANETLTKAILEKGGKVAEIGAPCPYKEVIKKNDYTASCGCKLNYKKKVDNAGIRNGVAYDYKPEHRNLGMFPLVGEYIWCKNDLSQIYVRAYSVNTNTARYFADGKEIPKELLAQWLPVQDYNSCSGIENPQYVVADEDDNIILAQDDDGNIVYNADGTPKYISLPPIMSLKLENVKLVVKGKNILEDLFTSEEWAESEVIAIRDSFYARMAEAEAKA